MTKTRRRRWGAPVGLALVCAHCSLTVLAAIASLALGSVAAGVPLRVLEWTLPPLVLFGLFVWLVRLLRSYPV